jgi:murein DD-endopeptidase MepM/ murein hydrolase activator NlpD
MIFNEAKVINPLLKVSLYFLAALILISLVMASTSANLPSEHNRLQLPELEKTLTDKKPVNRNAHNWQVHNAKIKKNGSLSQALDRIGIPKITAYKIQKTKNSRSLTNLKVGDELKIWVDDQNQLQKIFYPKSETQHFELTRDQNKFIIKTINKKIEKIIISTSGVIQDSLYLSGTEAGLSAKTIMSLSDIFSWEIDFIRQLRRGDPFKIIYEKKYIDGVYIGDGDILAAEITTNRNQIHNAFLLKDKNGQKIGYYDAKKRNLRKAFLRNPVDYVRITSKFNPRRFHPVLKKWKSHRGVDYGGPVGTPIRATGDGRITRRNRSSTYGKVIYIQHARKYLTVYAHLSRFGKYKRGQYVKQGQVIGYLGATGRVTGPHLHYEFRKNGVHKDPLRMKFPNAGSVPRKYRKQFVQYAKLMQSQFERNSTSVQLAGKFE